MDQTEDLHGHILREPVRIDFSTDEHAEGFHEAAVTRMGVVNPEAAAEVVVVGHQAESVQGSGNADARVTYDYFCCQWVFLSVLDVAENGHRKCSGYTSQRWASTEG